MENKDYLPFPEPSSHDIAQVTAYFMEKFGGIADYTEAQATREATTHLVFGQAMLSGFLQDTGRVFLSEGRSFRMQQRTSVEKE